MVLPLEVCYFFLDFFPTEDFMPSNSQSSLVCINEIPNLPKLQTSVLSCAENSTYRFEGQRINEDPWDPVSVDSFIVVIHNFTA